MRQIRISFDIKNSLRPLVLHIYIHFRVFTLHVHALLYFILRTMCEAGGNRRSYYSQYFFRQNDDDPPQNVNEQVPMATLVSIPGCLSRIPCSPHPSRPSTFTCVASQPSQGQWKPRRWQQSNSDTHCPGLFAELSCLVLQTPTDDLFTLGWFLFLLE